MLDRRNLIIALSNALKRASIAVKVNGNTFG
jgi:hypothetical protein